MTGTTLDTGALIALEAGSPFMRALVRRAQQQGVVIAVPAGVVAQAWRDGSRQARVASFLRSSSAQIVPLDGRVAKVVGARCGKTGASDVVDVSVIVCAREHGHEQVVTSDPGDLRKIDSKIRLVAPG
jgi:hypothetical protein